MSRASGLLVEMADTKADYHKEKNENKVSIGICDDDTYEPNAFTGGDLVSLSKSTVSFTFRKSPEFVDPKKAGLAKGVFIVIKSGKSGNIAQGAIVTSVKIRYTVDITFTNVESLG